MLHAPWGGERWEEAIMTRHLANEMVQWDQKQATRLRTGTGAWSQRWWDAAARPFSGG